MTMYLWRWEQTASMWEVQNYRTVPARVRGRTAECRQTPTWWCTVWGTLLRRYDNTGTGTATRCLDLSHSCRPHTDEENEVVNVTDSYPHPDFWPFDWHRYNCPCSNVSYL